MPLTLVTGPANAAKAGYVLERLRDVLHREPLLVVPTAADVAHYERELAAGGVVFGAQVLTFARLVRELGRVAGVGARPLGLVARERVVEAAIATRACACSPRRRPRRGSRARRVRCSQSCSGRWSSPRASRVRCGRGAGCRTPTSWPRCTPPTAGGWRRSSARPRGRGVGGAQRLRADPAAWGRRPVFLYGFDELSRAQLDAVETLSRLCEADVWVTLPYEPGRHALAGSAATVHELAPLGEVVELPEQAEHYAGAARPALHHLERGLFEPGAERRAPNGAVRLLEAGGERAEAEIVGAEVLELMRDGVAAEDIAVLVWGLGIGRAVRAGAGDLRDPGRVDAGGCRWGGRGSAPACLRARGGGAARRPRGGPADLAADARRP